MPVTPRLRLLASVSAALLATGCGGYSFTLNDQTLFEPPPLFSDYRIADAALSACVRQAIADAGITRAEDLHDLNCSSAGIRSLAGIEVFIGLERIGLDGNALQSLSPLEVLTGLKLVQARSNKLGTLDAGLCKGSAKHLALAGNENLACADISRLRNCGVTVDDAPAHCSGQ